MAADLSALEHFKLWEKLQKKDCDFAWAILGAEEQGKTSKVYIKALGDQSVAELATLLGDDNLFHVLLRVTAVDKGSNRTKLCFFSWMGPEAPFKAKSRFREISKHLSTYCSGHAIHVELHAQDEMTGECRRSDRAKRTSRCAL
jgi:hypothetical protein